MPAIAASEDFRTRGPVGPPWLTPTYTAIRAETRFGYTCNWAGLGEKGGGHTAAASSRGTKMEAKELGRAGAAAGLPPPPPPPARYGSARRLQMAPILHRPASGMVYARARLPATPTLRHTRPAGERLCFGGAVVSGHRSQLQRSAAGQERPAGPATLRGPRPRQEVRGPAAERTPLGSGCSLPCLLPSIRP